MSTDYRGKFKQGATANIIIKITTFDGSPVDPFSITCTITGPSEIASLTSEVVSEEVPYQVRVGFYVYEWDIDDDQEPGTYVVAWDYTLDEVDIQETQSVVVVELGPAPVFYGDRVLAMRDALEQHIICAQRIPVYFEQAKPTRDRITYRFSFANWNQSTGTKIYRNQEVISEGYEIDYIDGSVAFDDQLMTGDVVNVDYSFKWFTDDDLQRFLGNAVQLVNAYPPVSPYTIETVPDRFIPVILYGAAKDAIRQLMMCLQFQQPQQVFGGPENAQKAFSNMESLKKNYESETEKLLEQKKYGPYPKIKLGAVPEYTLPGGRSRWFRMLFK